MTCIFEHVFLWVAPCLFKAAFLNKAAKFKDNAKKKKKEKEKATILMFSLYLFIPVCDN